MNSPQPLLFLRQAHEGSADRALRPFQAMAQYHVQHRGANLPGNRPIVLLAPNPLRGPSLVITLGSDDRRAETQTTPTGRTSVKLSMTPNRPCTSRVKNARIAQDANSLIGLGQARGSYVATFRLRTGLCRCWLAEIDPKPVAWPARKTIHSEQSRAYRLPPQRREPAPRFLRNFSPRRVAHVIVGAARCALLTAMLTRTAEVAGKLWNARCGAPPWRSGGANRRVSEDGLAVAVEVLGKPDAWAGLAQQRRISHGCRRRSCPSIASRSKPYRKTAREPPRTAKEVRSLSKSVTPRSSHTTPSPSTVADTGSASMPSTIAGTLSVQSLPWRLNTRTRSPSRRAMKRKPSCLIS